MRARINIESVTMPAGQYWVGDPCYAVPNERWQKWLEAADYENAVRFLLAELDGHPVLGIGTAYGDGLYTDDQGRDYPVDAGLIGVVPVEVARPDVTGMHLVDFEDDFECRYDDGTIVLGLLVVVDTDPPMEEEEPW